ncbi:MAG: barstar family protein [Nitrospirota bacterium]
MSIGKRHYTLNGQSIHSLDDFYDEISRQLSLPAYFGRNLDALWDVLSTDVEGPVEIFWRNARASKQALGEDFEKVLKVLKELEGEREDFKVILQ